MILTHTGKFGDFIPSLIISNYYWKHENEKTTFILTNWFKNIKGIKEFLMLQDFTEDVIFDPYVVNNFDMGGQPYHFTPKKLKNEIFYNLGMNGFPTEYLGKFYTNEHNLKYDIDINLKFIDDKFPESDKNKTLYTHFHDDRWDKEMYVINFTELLPNRGAIAFDPKKSLLYNLNLAYYSEKTIVYPNGFSVLLDLCKIQFELINGSVNPSIYYLNQNL